MRKFPSFFRVLRIEVTEVTYLSCYYMSISPSRPLTIGGNGGYQGDTITSTLIFAKPEPS